MTEASPIKAGVPAKPFLIAGVSLALGVCFDVCFFDQMPGASFLLCVLLVIGGIAGVARYLGQPLTPSLRGLFVLLAWLGVMVCVRTSPLVTALNIAGCFFLLLLAAKIAFTKSLADMSVEEYLKLPFLPVLFVLPFLHTVLDVVTMREVREDRTTVMRVVKGMVMTLPILAMFLVLFSSADLVFKKYFWDALTLKLTPEGVFRLFLILMSASVFTGAFAYLCRPAAEGESPAPRDQDVVIGPIEYGILLGSVNALFFGFILVQVAYLFGGEGHIASQGFTYAQYARKGFFELIAVAAISLLLLLTTEKYAPRGARGHALGFRVLSSALMVQVVLIMVSAYKRLGLYEEAFGFTILRLYSHAFILLLAVVFVLLAHKILRNGREQTFLIRVMAAVMVFVTGMNLLNPDAFIAKRNLKRFEVTGKLDADYLSQLSPDAWPVTLTLLDRAPEDTQKEFARHFFRHHLRPRLRQPPVDSWQSWNLSRRNGERVLRPYAAVFEPFTRLPSPDAGHQ